MWRTEAEPGSEELPAGIAHDLGNLIQIASSAVNIVTHNPRTVDRDFVLASARTSLERAGAMVKRAIGAARAPAMEQVDLAACLAETESLFRVLWERGVGLEVRTGGDLPVVRCDRLYLQNAVLNLLLNARDATPDGGIVSLYAEQVALETGTMGIELRVVDHGVGMTPETVARAFEPFFTTKPGGLGGVGLTMVEQFARKAGGRVLIESEFGTGTTVKLQLPAFKTVATPNRTSRSNDASFIPTNPSSPKEPNP